jgi:hypothetical protein
VKSATRVRCCLWVASLAIPLLATAGIRNGDFHQGLVCWKTAWHVAVADGELQLSDTSASHAFAFQALACPTGAAVTVEFDFFNALAATNAAGTFRDSFYASVYQVNDPAGFVLEHDKFGASRGLMDMDAGGPFNVHGSVTNSVKGAGWSHFSGAVSATHSNVVIVFELYDLDLAPGNSAVRVDNVTVAP